MPRPYDPKLPGDRHQWVNDRRSIKAADKAVLHILAKHYSVENGYTTVLVDTIAREAGLGRDAEKKRGHRTVFNSLHRLEAAHLIKRRRRWGGRGGKAHQISTVYELNFHRGELELTEPPALVPKQPDLFPGPVDNPVDNPVSRVQNLHSGTGFKGAKFAHISGYLKDSIVQGAGGELSDLAPPLRMDPQKEGPVSDPAPPPGGHMTPERVQHAVEEIRRACALADGLPDDPTDAELEAFCASDDPLPSMTELPAVAVVFIDQLVAWANAGSQEASWALSGLEQLGLVEFGDDDPDGDGGERVTAAA